MAKQRQGKVDAFRCSLSIELDAELLRLADKPNISGIELYKWLLEHNYKGGLNSVYTWLEQRHKAGEKAQKFNALMADYQGVVPEKALEKLLVVFTEQLDNSLVEISALQLADSKAKPEEYLKLLPHLGREIRGCVAAINGLKYISDRRSLELAGAARLAQELRLIFVDTPFESALEEAIKGAMVRIEEES